MIYLNRPLDDVDHDLYASVRRVVFQACLQHDVQRQARGGHQGTKSFWGRRGRRQGAARPRSRASYFRRGIVDFGNLSHPPPPPSIKRSHSLEQLAVE